MITASLHREDDNIPESEYPCLVEGHYGIVVILDRPNCGMVIHSGEMLPNNHPSHEIGEYRRDWQFDKSHVCNHSVYISNQLIQDRLKIRNDVQKFVKQVPFEHVGRLMENRYGTVAFVNRSGEAIIINRSKRDPMYEDNFQHVNVWTSSQLFDGYIILGNKREESSHDYDRIVVDQIA